MRKYLSLEDFAYKKGDVISVFWEGGGFITTGGKSFRMTIPVDRPVLASSAKLEGNLTLRQNSTYIFGDANENTSIEALSQNCQRITPQGISFSLSKEDKFTECENNSACGVLFTGTITFT